MRGVGTTDAESVRAEVRAWLDANWDENRPLAEWREMLADSGWGCPTWPVEWFGRGLSPALGAVVDSEFDRIAAVGVAGGAAMSLYLINMRVSMLAFMGTSAWFFFFLNLLKIPVVVGLGVLNAQTLLADLWFAPLIVVGALVGMWAFTRMNERVFANVALTLSAIAALWLLVHG